MRLVLAGTAAALVAAVSRLVGGALRDGGGSTRALPVKAPAAGESFAAGFSGGDTASFVRRLVDELRSHPGEAKGYTLLGLAYEQRARETGDPAYYSKGTALAARASSTQGLGDRSALGPLALARHRFREALDSDASPGARPHGRRLRRPRRRGVELGRYDRRSGLRPDERAATSLVLRSCLVRARADRTHRCRRAGDAARNQCGRRRTRGRRLDARPAGGAAYLSTGQPKQAEITDAGGRCSSFPATRSASSGHGGPGADRTRPSQRRRPLRACGRSTGFRCRSTWLCSAISTAPGRRTREAQQQYALIGAIERLLAANGVRNDLDIALFDVDHGVRLQHALATRTARATGFARASSATTSSPGRSHATAPVARPFTTRGCRCASAHVTPTSTSTAA